MSWFIDFVKSSIGNKILMAITGVALLLFAIGHMLGNLQVYGGPSMINGYAKGLRDLGPLLWIARGGLIAVVLLHIGSAIGLTMKNRAARPVSYAYNDHVVTSYAARTMVMSGMIIFAFIAFHLAHYTFLWVDTAYQGYTDALGRHDVYKMVTEGFSNYAVSAFYIVAVFLLCSHLSHGIPSFFQTLGLRHPKYQPVIEKSGPVIAGLLFLGYVSVPIGVIAGWV